MARQAWRQVSILARVSIMVSHGMAVWGIFTRHFPLSASGGISGRQEISSSDRPRLRSQMVNRR
jgi:hypothetical protein